MSYRISVLAALILAAGQACMADERLTFEKHIRPIFRAHCFDCHGATADIKGGLDLRLVRFQQKGGESGPAISPGKPTDSYLLDRIRSGEMPPGEARLSDKEIETIERWITAGAKTARPEPENIGEGLGITPEERSFWSFQPIQRPDVPEPFTFPETARIRSPIDALVFGAFPKGTSFAPDADRATLIKRVFLIVTGLPPSPNDMQRWQKESSGDWLNSLVNELLDSPHYGEHWARHWLDVAGYADSEGYNNNDAERPWAWKYRDWVIQALNDDKPFDQFIIEQLAGDELAGAKDGDFTAEQIALLTATGFLRMAADGTGSGGNDAAGRNQVMTDTLKIVGTSLLGLSVHCAQCHDHRYDPIPQTDYYSLRAVFEPALDWKAWKTPAGRRISLYTMADRNKAADVEKKTQTIAEQRLQKLAEYMKQALDAEIKKFPADQQAELRAACETPAGKRNDRQKQLLKQNPSLNISPGNLYQYIPDSKPKLAEFDKQIAKIRAEKPAESFLRALVEPPNAVPPTHLFHRGDHQQPKQQIQPASLTVTAPDAAQQTFPANDETLSTTGRRLAFAKWLVNGKHPLVARVIVNRLWMHHFGKGLVSTPADFGKLGAAPEHPELLDWLAAEFMQQGWSLKNFHRQIILSTVWRQSAQRDADRSGDANRSRNSQSATDVAFARRRLVRLSAETIRDRMLAASGQLDRTTFGPPVAIKKDDTGQVIVNGEQKRRSLYVKVRRSQPVAMLQAFDAPVMQTNCEVRASSTVATQSLMLMNGEFTLAQAGKLAARSQADVSRKETRPDIDPALLASLKEVPKQISEWSCGYGFVDEASGRVNFQRLPHWTGSQWQGGPKLPDEKLGWVLVMPTGGHPGDQKHAAIRRWTARSNGTISIRGDISHPSKNGDGVRCRVVSSRTGVVGEWVVAQGTSPTAIKSLDVQSGDTIDFVTDCRGSETSDTFAWTAEISFSPADGQANRKPVKSSTQSACTPPPESTDDTIARIARCWELALCRPASEEELRLATSFVCRQLATYQNDSSKLPKNRPAVEQAMINLCQSLFGSNEFLYLE